jgi:hypothetical protein
MISELHGEMEEGDIYNALNHAVSDFLLHFDHRNAADMDLYQYRSGKD